MTDPIRASHRVSLVVFILAHFALAALVNLVFFASNTFTPLASATGGLFTGSLLVNLILVALLIWLLVGRVGGLRPYDVGLIARHIPIGIAFGVGLWACAQVIHALFGLLYHGEVAPQPVWRSDGGAMLIGWLITQLLGSALFEEIAYRGFLFPQMYLRLNRWSDDPQRRLAWAVILSQILFALSHIPNRIYLGMSTPEIAFDLLMLFGWGGLYTLIYLRTGNLFLVVAIHALGNAPTTLFKTAPILEMGGGSLLIYALAVVALFGVPLYKAYRTHGLPHIDEDDVLEADAETSDFTPDGCWIEAPQK